MSDTTATPETTDTELTPNDRRALLRKLAIGGAGAAAGAVMLSNGRVPPAPRAPPGPTILSNSAPRRPTPASPRRRSSTIRPQRERRERAR
jgi:hypothetical protein